MAVMTDVTMADSMVGKTVEPMAVKMVASRVGLRVGMTADKMAD